MSQRVGKRTWTGVIGVLSALTWGCGDGEFQIKVAKPAAERPDVRVAGIELSSVSLPDPTPFNVTPFASHESGACSARCSATDQGAGAASVDAAGGGFGWAEFHVGYAFDQLSDHPVSAVIEVAVECAQSVEATAGEPNNIAKATLQFLVRDSNGVTLHRETLAAASSETGNRRWSASEASAVDVVLPPGVGYFVTVAGRAEASAGGTRKSVATVEVKSCRMKVVCRKADEAAAAPPAARP